MANSDLTKRDVALGGKIHCEGCGADWWISGGRALYFLENGFPTTCGNSAKIEIVGSRTDCEDESEMTFIPFDVEESVAIFHADGQHEVAEAMPAQAAKILEEVED